MNPITERQLLINRRQFFGRSAIGIGTAALASIVVLGVICTAVGLIVFFRLIIEAGPNRASVITYVNPVVAVIFGIVVLSERLGVMSLLGLLVILGGSWLATRGSPQSSDTHA